MRDVSGTSQAEGLVSKVAPSANTGTLAPGDFKAAGERAQARQAGLPAMLYPQSKDQARLALI